MEQTLKDIIIEAGLELLRRDGLRLTPENVTYANVFRFLDERYDVTVTRGSVHERIWPNQDAFRSDVMKAMVRWTGKDSPATAVMLEAAADIPNASGWAPAAETIRRAGNAHFRLRVNENDASFLPAPHAIPLSAGRNDRDELKQLNGRRANDNLFRWTNLAGFIGENFDIRVRPEIGLRRGGAYRILAQLGATVLTGLCLDYLAGSTFLGEELQLPSPINGEPVPWTYYSLAINAVGNFLFEPTPDGAGDEAKPDDGFEWPVPAYTVPPAPSVSELLARSGDDESGRIRRRRDDLKLIVIGAAIEMIESEGLTLRPEDISYKPVFRIVEEQRGFKVNRSSVHGRFWPDQDTFRYDVLAAVAKSIPTSANSYEDLLAKTGATPAVVDASEQTLRDGVLAMSRYHTDFHRHDGGHLLRFLLKSSLIGQPDDERAESLKQVLTETHLGIIKQLIRVIDAPLSALGFKPSAELGMTWDQTLFVYAALSTSCSLAIDFEVRAGATTITEEYELPRLDGGPPDLWPLKAIAQLAFQEYFFDRQEPS